MTVEADEDGADDLGGHCLVEETKGTRGGSEMKMQGESKSKFKMRMD